MPVTGAKQLATAAPFGWLKGKIWGLIFANFSFLRNGTLMLSHKECNKKSERIWQHGSSHSSHRSGLYIFDRKQEIFSSVLFSSNPLSQFVQAKSLNWMVVYTIRPHTQLRTCLSYGPCQTPTLWFCVERHKDFWGQSWNSAFCFTLVQSVEEIQETAGFNFKKWCHTRSLTLFDGSIQVDDIDHHLETYFGGLNFVKAMIPNHPFEVLGLSRSRVSFEFSDMYHKFHCHTVAIVFFPTRHWKAFKQRKRYPKQHLDK